MTLLSPTTIITQTHDQEATSRLLRKTCSLCG